MLWWRFSILFRFDVAMEGVQLLGHSLHISVTHDVLIENVSRGAHWRCFLFSVVAAAIQSCTRGSGKSTRTDLFSWTMHLTGWATCAKAAVMCQGYRVTWVGSWREPSGRSMTALAMLLSPKKQFWWGTAAPRSSLPPSLLSPTETRVRPPLLS